MDFSEAELAALRCEPQHLAAFLRAVRELIVAPPPRHAPVEPMGEQGP